jgi:hypothetical protein
VTHPIHRPPVLLGLAASLVLVGCAGKVDKIVVKRVVTRALAVPDVDQACEIGVSLRSPLASVSRPERPPRQAVLIAEFTAALCDEARAFEHEIAAGRALSKASGLEPGARAVAARDARLAADRSHARAAARFQRAWEQGNAEFGALGQGECPRLKQRDELPFMLALVAGMQVVLHDSAAGSPLQVPKATILDVARAAECIDDDTWWAGPSGLQAAAWATIPGSAPEGVDPWEMLADAAQRSDGTGVRMARALQVTIGANAGRPDVVREGLVGHAAARAATPSSAEFALFDQYALVLSRHQSDLIWLAEEGYRTPVFGELPGAAGPAVPETDPFGGDPFGGAPFGAEASEAAVPGAAPTSTDPIPESP